MGHKKEMDYFRDEDGWHLFCTHRFPDGKVASRIYSLEENSPGQAQGIKEKIQDFAYVGPEFFNQMPEKGTDRKRIFEEARGDSFKDISGYVIYYSSKNEEDEIFYVGPVLEKKLVESVSQD